MKAPQGFSKTYQGANVYVEQGSELANLSRLDTKAQERRIYLQLAQGNQPAKVIIYKGAGLIGGMQKGSKDEFNNDNGVEGDEIELIDLPEEILQRILLHVPSDQRKDVSLVNKLFLKATKELQKDLQKKLVNDIKKGNIEGVEK